MMKKIKKRTGRSSIQWHIYVLTPPKDIDPQGLTTLLLLADPRNQDFGDFLVLPRPAEVEEVVAAIEEAYRYQPLNRRPGRIQVTTKAYAEAFERSPIFEGVSIVVEQNKDFEKELLRVMSQEPEKISDGPVLGIGPRREEFLALVRRAYATKAWLHLFDGEYLVLDVDGAPLERPIVSVMGLMGQMRGFAFFRSIEEFEDFAARAQEFGAPDLEDLDQLLVSFDVLSEFDESLQKSLTRQELTVGEHFIAWASLFDAERDELWIDDEDEAASVVRHLEALTIVLEDLAARGFPPYPQISGLVEKEDWKIQVGVHEEAARGYEEDLELLEEYGLLGEDQKILRIRVELEGITPPIYRVIEVPDHLSMAGLHDVIQRTMGWQNVHLWSFHYKGTDFTLIDDEEEEPMGAFDEEDARITTIKEAIGARSKNFSYVYNYQDDWRHALRVEERKAPEAGVTYPRLIEGARNCPPEAVGGVEGYADAILALEEPESADEELLDWIEGYDPEAFNPEVVELPGTFMLNRIWLHEEPVEMVDFEEDFDDEQHGAMEALVYELQNTLPPEDLVDASDETLRELAEDLSTRHSFFDGPEEIFAILEHSRKVLTMMTRDGGMGPGVE